MKMKALSVRDPHARLITLGLKPVENRSRRTNFRGRVYIHVSKRFDLEGLEWILQNIAISDRIAFHAGKTWGSSLQGAIIGEVDIVDCLPLDIVLAHGCQEFKMWATGPWCWMLANAVLYEQPILGVKGKLGFFEPEFEKVTV